MTARIRNWCSIFKVLDTACCADLLQSELLLRNQIITFLLFMAIITYISQNMNSHNTICVIITKIAGRSDQDFRKKLSDSSRLEGIMGTTITK